MGKGEEKSGLMGSKWMTLVLIVVLVVLAVAFFLILKNPKQFEIFKKKKQRKVTPLKPTVYHQLHNLNDRPKLELVDDRLRVVAELSWQKPVSSPQV